MRGGHHTLHLLAPYLARDQRRHLLALSNAYNGESAASNPSPVPPTVDMAA
ncbi:hypothetical protein D3C72_2322140 [compost metagenome]